VAGAQFQNRRIGDIGNLIDQPGELLMVLEQVAKTFQGTHDLALDPIVDVVAVQVFQAVGL
jgi:hypothetical protein